MGSLEVCMTARMREQEEKLCFVKKYVKIIKKEYMNELEC